MIPKRDNQRPASKESWLPCRKSSHLPPVSFRRHSISITLIKGIRSLGIVHGPRTPKKPPPPSSMKYLGLSSYGILSTLLTSDDCPLKIHTELISIEILATLRAYKYCGEVMAAQGPRKGDHMCLTAGLSIQIRAKDKVVANPPNVPRFLSILFCHVLEVEKRRKTALEVCPHRRINVP